MKLSKAMLMYRAKNRMNMKQFAEKAGITMQTVYNIESAGQKPSRVTRAKIELVLNGEYELDDEDDVEEDDDA